MKKTPLEMVWGECVGSLLLGNECAAVEVSVYFCRLSFQGPDWQLFLEPESHSLLNRLRREERGGGDTFTHTHSHQIHTYTHARTLDAAHERNTRVDTHAYAHLCAGMLTAPFARSVSFQADKQTGCFHTHSLTNTHIPPCPRACAQSFA